MMLDITDDNAIRKLHVELARAMNCVFKQFEISDDKNPVLVLTEIEDMTSNTKKRLLTSRAVSKASDGMVLSLASGDTCE